MGVKRARRLVAAVAAGCFTITPLTGCGGSGLASGPLQSVSQNGQKLVEAGAVAVAPGESADFTAYLVNTASGPVTPISAVAIPVPGQTVGKLVHVAVNVNHDYVGEGAKWPPSVPVNPLGKATLGRGSRGVTFAFTGDTVGRNYALAGIKIKYRYQGQVYEMTAWSIGVACVIPASQLGPHQMSSCPHALVDSIQQQIIKMANS